MLAAEAVAQFRNDFAGAKHILEFAGAVQRNGPEHNVIVDVRMVIMRRHEEREIPVQQPGSQLIADFVGFLRRYFSRLEGLPHLICNHFIANAPSSFRDIGISVQQELLVSGFGRTGIGGNQFALLSLVRVLHIIQPCFQALGDCLALVDVHRYDAGGCHCYPPDCRKTRPSEEKRVS